MERDLTREEMLSEPESKGSLGQHAMRGAFWSFLFSILNKVTTFASQIVLAWFLVPEDFGLIALATSITSLMSVISVGCLGDIIVQQKDDGQFKKDFGQIFWLCNSLNFVLVLLPMLASPWISRAYHQPKLLPVLLLIEANGLFVGLSLVYGCALKRSLKFKTLSVIFFVSGTIQSLVSIFMAWKGYGAYSIVVPIVLSSIVALLYQVYAAGFLPVGKPEPKLWLAYLAPSFWLLFLTILGALQSQGTSFVMGFSQNTAQIGLYFWGFSLANQIVFLICNNLRQVLFPTFAKLNGQSERQSDALRKSTRIMLIVIAYFCVIQAVTARPMIGLIFPARWLAAAPVVSWISLGMLTQPLSILCFSMLMAKAQYRDVVINSIVQGVLVVLCAMIGSLPAGSDSQSAASWTALGFFLGGLFSGWQMLTPFGHGLKVLAQILTKPLLLALACGLCGVLAVQAVQNQNLYWQLGMGILGVSAAYALAIRLFDMESYRALRSRI